MKPFKPLLASTAERQEDIRLPVYASVKLDGIRGIVCPDRGVVSRTLKPIPNEYIREKILQEARSFGLSHLDGEIGVGDPADPAFFNKTVSAVMSKKGQPDFMFYVFDHWGNPDLPFSARSIVITDDWKWRSQIFRRVEQRRIDTLAELQEYEESVLADGHEGIMTRSVDGLYKFGRSTLKEQILLKRKPFADDEAEIIGFVERMTNLNEATKDSLGHTKRSTHQANMRPTGTLGALRVRHPTFGEFEIGGGKGMTDSFRQQIWDSQDDYLGKQVTFLYQKCGTQGKPRIPTFKAFREV